MYFIIRPSSVSGRIVSCAEEVTSVKNQKCGIDNITKKAVSD